MQGAQDNDIDRITKRVDELIAGEGDALAALRELSRHYGAEQVAREARIAIALWQSRVDEVTDAIDRLLGEGGP
jgi:hypothetical protein